MSGRSGWAVGTLLTWVLMGCPAAPTTPTDATDPTPTAPATADTGPSTDTWVEGPARLTAEARLNPDYPTVVTVTWVQSWNATVWVEYAIDGGDWQSTPQRQLSYGEHEQLVLGAPFESEVAWRVRSSNEFGDEQTDDALIETGELPSIMPIADVRVHTPASVDAQMAYVLVLVSEGRGASSRGWTMVMDRLGQVVWAHRSPANTNTMHPRLNLAEDSFLIDHSTYFAQFDCGAGSEVVELKIDGSVVRTVDAPGQHHPFTEMPDGTIAYAAYRDCYGSPGDDVVVLARPDGTRQDLFSCADFLDDRGEFGYCGSNTLSHDEARGVFLFSLFTHDSIVELDADKGTPNRWFGHINGAWGFSPASSAFDYQHGGYFTEDGTLLLSTHSDRNPHNFELAVREYSLDPSTSTLRQVWSFGRGEGVLGPAMGEAHRLPGGNTLHNHGTHAVLREITPEGDVVWDVRWEDSANAEDGHLVGRSAPITGSLYDFAPESP
ncbi:MAG: hypothetical protein KTR31_24060 [Myxococcales bacterium]|nr:hypothetical protein [Myxococcales bacterium]